MSASVKRVSFAWVILLLVAGCRQVEPTATPLPPTPTQIAVAPSDTPLPATATPMPPTARPTLALTDTPPPATPVPPETPTAKPAAVPYEVIDRVPYVEGGDPAQTLSIYLPETESRQPLTLVVQSGASIPHFVKHFAGQGYVIVSFDSRDDSYQEEIQDAFCALAWTHANAGSYGIQPDSIVTVGGSMWGGNAAILGLVDDPAPFLAGCPHPWPEGTSVRGVVTLAGVFDYSEEADFFHGFIDSIAGFMGGTQEEVPDTWADASAITWVKGNEPAFLLLHGTSDVNVDAHQSAKFASALEKAGVEVELVLVSGTDHGGITRHWQAFEAAEAFLVRLSARTETGASPMDRPQPTAAPPLALSHDTASQVELLHTLDGHSDRIIDLVFSGDGAYVASSSLDRTIKLWDVVNWQEVHTFSMSKVGFNGIALSPDGRLLASADAIWDVESGQVVHTLEEGRDVPGPVAFSPDGATLAIALESRAIKLWDVVSGEVVRTFTEQPDNVTFRIVFSPDGALLAAGVHGGMVRLWDVASGRIAGTLQYGDESGDVHDVAFSPDGSVLASGGTDSTVRLWDVTRGQLLHTLRHGNGLYGVAISPDGSLVASAVCDRTVKLWDVASGRLLRSLPHADEVMSVAFSPDGTLLVSGGYDNKIYLWGVSR
jgi:WD40 repeat protein